GSLRRLPSRSGVHIASVGCAALQAESAGSGFGERVDLGLGLGIAEDVESTADEAEVDPADDIGIFVSGLEQRAAGESEAARLGVFSALLFGRRGLLFGRRGFGGEAESIEEG